MSFTLFLTVKTIAELNPKQSDKFEKKKKDNNKLAVVVHRFSRQRRIWSFHVVVLQWTVKKCTKIYNTLA